ncbi:tousled-like kinase [Anaeramoeba flamelloides]|uniref:Tousled-like kinase n=1 Tax=Anaeramoeba flamelloides TaxID=1746091 RepID=A0ABQ8YTT2_9EUKA|nr:tousled-like kinase [Anaeramoeba flamelloides]
MQMNMEIEIHNRHENDLYSNPNLNLNKNNNLLFQKNNSYDQIGLIGNENINKKRKAFYMKKKENQFHYPRTLTPQPIIHQQQKRKRKQKSLKKKKNIKSKRFSTKTDICLKNNKKQKQKKKEKEKEKEKQKQKEKQKEKKQKQKEKEKNQKQKQNQKEDKEKEEKEIEIEIENKKEKNNNPNNNNNCIQKEIKKKKNKDKGESNKDLLKKIEKYKNKSLVYKDKCESLENELQEIKDVSQKLEELESEYKDQLLKEREITSRAREEIYRLMVLEAQHEKKKLKEHVRKDNLRLGTFKMKRIGLTYETEYINGEDFQEIHEKLIKCMQEEEKIKELRKILHKNKPAPISDSSRESLEQQNPEYLKQLARYHQQEEVYKLRLATIRKEKVELEKVKENLKIQKKLQMKRIRRLENEENSRLKGNPLLKNDRYLILALLGKGGFSEVFKTYDLLEFRLVACKFHQLNLNWNPEQSRNYLKHSLREYEIQKSLNHKRIVRLFDVFEVDEQSFCTIMEYCPRGDLDTLLKTKRTLVERQARSIISQIFEGLEYLNSQRRKIIHYDLKPGNILFDDDGIKITDFGLSKIIFEEYPKIELTSQGSGTHWYLPPECFERKNVPMISSKVDVWSVGIMFFQMLYGYKPFGEKMSPIELWNQNVIINQGKNIEFPKKPHISNQTKEFIKLCLTYDQEKRPDVLTIIQNPYLNPPLKIKKN